MNDHEYMIIIILESLHKRKKWKVNLPCNYLTMLNVEMLKDKLLLIYVLYQSMMNHHKQYTLQYHLVLISINSVYQGFFQYITCHIFNFAYSIVSCQGRIFTEHEGKGMGQR